MEDNIEQLLIKTGKLLQFYGYNKEDPAFMRYFNKHFYEIRAKGYSIELTEISTTEVFIQIIYGDRGITRPEVLRYNKIFK